MVLATYQREPLPEDREKARLAVECGADVVVGHHPHVIQPMEGNGIESFERAGKRVRQAPHRSWRCIWMGN